MSNSEAICFKLKNEAAYRMEVVNPWYQTQKDNQLQSLEQIILSRDGSSGAMMTSSNGNIFCVTGHLCGEFTGPQWIPRTKASDAELWCFLWSVPE